MATVRHLGFLKLSQFLSKIQIIAYFYVHMQNLVKIGRPAAELLRVFDFQNGGRPHLCFGMTSDHSRFVFNGPNILLKLHVDRVYTLQDIAIFKFGRFCLKLHIYESFWGVLGDITLKKSDIAATPKRTVLGRKHVVRVINRENSSTGPGRVPEKIKYSIT